MHALCSSLALCLTLLAVSLVTAQSSTGGPAPAALPASDPAAAAFPYLVTEQCNNPAGVAIDLSSGMAFVACSAAVLAMRVADANLTTLTASFACTSTKNVLPPTQANARVLASCYNKAVTLEPGQSLQTPTALDTCARPVSVDRSRRAAGSATSGDFVGCLPFDGPASLTRVRDAEVVTLFSGTTCGIRYIGVAEAEDRVYVQCGLGSLRWVSASTNLTSANLTLVPMPTTGGATAYPTNMAYDVFNQRLLVELGGFAVTVGLYTYNPAATADAAFTIILDSSVCSARSITPDPLTGHIYVGCYSGSGTENALVAIQQGTNAVQTLLTQSQCDTPSGAAVTASGRVLVTCSTSLAGATSVLSVPMPTWSGSPSGTSSSTGGTTPPPGMDGSSGWNAADNTQAAWTLIGATIAAAAMATRMH